MNTYTNDFCGGVSMNQRYVLMQLLEKGNGLRTSGEAREAGVSYKTIQRLHQSGALEKLEHGLYMDPNHIEDEYYIAQYRCKEGIFSHETALYFHDLSDRTPITMMLTIPSGYNTRLLVEHDKYKFFYIDPALHQLGKIDIESPFGHKIEIYDKERTICDCIKKKSYLDTDLVVEAIKKYMKTPGADFGKLMEYAGVFKINEIVRSYLEVLV
jgi:predicted transcriptional regulator of viral defense system